MKRIYLEKYKKNLRLEYPFIYSYDTKVAEIIDNSIHVNKYYSETTTKHINYVAKELGLEIKRH